MSNLTKEEREKLFNENIGLIHKVIQRYPMLKNTEYYQDLWQEGYLGLWKAAERYDNTLNVKFSDYAYKIIWGNVYLYIDRFIKQNKRLKGFEEGVKISSLDINVDSEGQGTSIIDLIPCEIDFTEELESKIVVEHILNVAKEVEGIRGAFKQIYDILVMQMNGYSQRKISEFLNVRQTTISFRIREFINYYRENYLYLGVA